MKGSVWGIIPTHPVNIPCGRKPEYAEPTISEVKGACSDDRRPTLISNKEEWNVRRIRKRKAGGTEERRKKEAIVLLGEKQMTSSRINKNLTFTDVAFEKWRA